MFGRAPKCADAGIPEHIIRRVQKMSDADLVLWSDQAIYTSGRYLSLFGRDPNTEYLSEARTGAQVLLAIVVEITRRAK